jgi:hypothetical protein|tara:strand:- start:1147 stop:2763 length:1617 start_codon:yes stop_codon:yes gene_type:complete
MAWYNNILDTGANVFGAGEGANAEKLEELGLIAKGARDKAKRQSMFQGLLGLGTSLIAQPRNKNYGSAAPYIGKAFLTGMDFAQNPFEQMGKDAEMAQKIKTYEDAQKIKTDREDYKKRLYSTIPGEDILTNRYETINRQGLDGQNIQAPNMGFVQKSKAGPPVSKMDWEVLQEIAVNDPEFAGQMLGNQKTMAEIKKLNAEANEGNQIKLNKNYKPEDYTDNSYFRYASKYLDNGLPNPDYGKDWVLVEKDTADLANYEEKKADIHEKAYNIEKELGLVEANRFRRDNADYFPEFKNVKGETTPTKYSDTEAVQVHERTEPTGPEIYGVSEDLYNKYAVNTYDGNKVFPNMYNVNLPKPQRDKLALEMPAAQKTVRETVNGIRFERALIAKIINSGDLDKMYGFQSYNPLNKFAGMPAATLKKRMDQLGNQEFMNNLINSKAMGATFGALSDTEGRRLENILVNVSTAGGAQEMELALMDLDDFLAQREQSGYAFYQGKWGNYDYKKAVMGITPWKQHFQIKEKEKPGAIKSITKVN